MEKTVQREQARELYFQTEMTQEQIAHLLNVNRKTVGLWIQQGQWRDMKQAALQSPGIILQELYEQLSCLNTAIKSRDIAHRYPTLEESTIQRRLIMSVKSFEQQSAGNYIQTYTELINEIAEGHPELSKEVCHYADDIIRRKYRRDTKGAQQYMFLNDDIDELDNLDKQQNEQSTQEPGPSGQPQNSIVPSPLEGDNEKSCDIKEIHITQQDQPLQPQTDLPTSQNNNSEKCDNTPQQNMEIKLPNGLTWLGNNKVFDPIINKQREIKMGEVDEFIRIGLGKYLK